MDLLEQRETRGQRGAYNRKRSPRFILFLVAGVVLWLVAIALFLMACAIPASWVPMANESASDEDANSAASPTAIVIERGSGASLPALTAVPALPRPILPTAAVPTEQVATPQATAALPVLVPTVAGQAQESGPARHGSQANQPQAPIQTGTLIDWQYIDGYNHAAIDELSRRFYPDTNLLLARHGVERYQVRFQTLNQHHELTPIRAELFIPTTDVPTEFPLFVYGSGTTGIGNECAPLDELTHGRNWGSYRTHMLSYAAQGYIAILPLWQGYDDLARTHPYFVAELEGPVLLDAARAVYQFFATTAIHQAQPAAALFLGGYSQGGHGAFAADAIAPAYAPELAIKGVIGHASAPNVEALMRETPALAPYIVYAYRDYYGAEVIEPAAVFQEWWLPTFDIDASNKCVDEIYKHYQGGQENIYRPEFRDSLYGKRLDADFPAFKQALDRNNVGSQPSTQVPALLLHGSADPIVTQQTNEAFLRQICQQGKPSTYYLYNNVHHFQTRQYSFVDTVQWMQAILSGIPVRQDCGAFLAQ